MKYTQIATMTDVAIKNQKSKKIEGTPFTAIDVEGGYIITIGRACVVGYIFESIEDIEKYIDKKDWELIGAMILLFTKSTIKQEITEIIEFTNKNIKEEEKC